jgi:three-Cys-motif partner protein
MSIRPRDTQTQVKHLILEQYLNAWGGIILHGLRGSAHKAQAAGRDFEAHFIYVDGFAGRGRYQGDRSTLLAHPDNAQLVWGSPVLGIRALTKLRTLGQSLGIPVRTNAILVERDPAVFSTLHESLDMAGWSQETRQTTDFESLADGEVALIQDDFCQSADKVRRFTNDGYRFAFYLLDPYGPSGIPLQRVVAPIIGLPRTDVMINFPYQDLHKKTGGVTPDITPAYAKAQLHYDALFGCTGWRQVRLAAMTSENDESQGERMEADLVDLYHQQLQKVDSTLAIKSVRLRFPDKERTMFYLFLTTHDGTGALRLNELLDKAQLREYELRRQFQAVRTIAEARDHGQLTFEEVLTPAREDLPRPSIGPARPTPAEIATEIERRFCGRTAVYREILAAFADSPHYATEMKNALTFLKRSGRVSYTELSNSTTITFATSSKSV